MKKLHTAGKLFKAMLLSGLLAACQNEEIVTSSLISESKTEDANARVSPVVRKLLTHGKIKLEYYTYGPAAGRLKKQQIGTSEGRWEYSYSGDSIVAKFYNSYNTFGTEAVYVLDANGKCIESSLSQAINNWKKVSHKYEYNEVGQLSKRYNKDFPTERQEFFYESINPSSLQKDLAYIKFYHVNGQQYQEVFYDYEVPNVPVKEDKYPLNPDYNLMKTDKYLPIFGKFHNNLVRYSYKKPIPYNGQPFDSYVHELYINYTDGYVFLDKLKTYIGASQQWYDEDVNMTYTPDQTATAIDPKYKYIP